MQRIPLEKRLEGAALKEGAMPAAGRLYLDTWFAYFSEMSGDPSYRAFYEEALKQYPFMELGNLFAAAFAYEAVHAFWPPEAVTEVLYRVLAEPFADERIYGTEGGNRT